MKTCKKCGFINTDDCLFCEKCGQSLAPQKKTKLIWFLVPLACVIVGLIAAVLLFIFWDKLPFKGEEKAQVETNISEEMQEDAKEKDETEEKEEESKDLEEEEVSKPENEQGQADSDNEDRQPEDDEKEEKTTDIDGVGQAYVEVRGTLIENDGYLGVQMPKPSSVCAYDDENEIVQEKDVEYLRIDNDGLEEYLGAEVLIKGKLSARKDGQFMLEIVKLEVQKEAAKKEREESAADGEEETDSGEHQYTLITADVTWQEAFDDCISRGGYLAQINSEEEYQSIIQMIEAEDKRDIHFYLGGRRDIDSREYYWVDKDNELSGEVLNPGENSWASSHWMESEPSFTSEEDQEMYMNMIYYQDNWVLNDVPMDITVYYSGKTGYICEFDR